MSVVSPLINDWIGNKLKWTFTYQPVTRPFSVPPNNRIVIPDPDHTFRAPEGTLLFMNVFFTSPYGGMTMESEPNLDFRTTNTALNNLVAGFTSPNNVTYVSVPPDTPPGLFGVNSNKEWPWEESCRLYVINTHPTQTITCLGYAYIMAYLKEPRKTTLLDIGRMALWRSLFPELESTIKNELKQIAAKQVEELSE